MTKQYYHFTRKSLTVNCKDFQNAEMYNFSPTDISLKVPSDICVKMSGVNVLCEW